jgi:hypothetical protein
VQFLAPIFGAAPHWIVGSLIFLATLVLSLGMTSLSVRPLAPVFEAQRHRGGQSLIGQTVVIKTTKVDDRVGQANYDDGGAGLQLEVRCKEGDQLKRGDEALITEHDDDRGIYWVEPMQALLGTGEAIKVPEQSAEDIASAPAGANASGTGQEPVHVTTSKSAGEDA